MAWFCAQCGSPNDAHAPACRVCGRQATPGAGPQAGGYGQPYAQAGYGQQAASAGFGQAPGGYAPPAQQAGYAPPAHQAGYAPPAPGGYAPPGGYGGPAPMMPTGAMKKRDDSGFKLGCAFAGCLGGGLVLASVLGVILLYASRDGASPSGGDTGGDERRAPPKSGSLRDTVPQEVGSYRAVSSRPLQVPRAVDAVLVVYRSGSLEMEHAVAVFASEDDAQTNLVESTKRVADSTKTTGDVVRIKNPQGDVIGLGSHFRANPEVFAYRIGKLMAILQGPPGEVIPFFQKLP